MKPEGAFLLRRQELASLLNLDECITAVERVFRSHAEGRTLQPGVLGVDASDGGFHIKAAGLKLDRTYFAAKVNGNFFHNMGRYGMPNIQGIISLCDGANGYPLAIMDSSEITIIQTGTATAVAAKYLARHDADVATICGCGAQGRILLRVLSAERKIVVDLLERCATIGDLQHALKQGVGARASVHAELGEVVAGAKPGRASRNEIISFDSTGTALQDVAAAALVYEKAMGAENYPRLNFAM